MSKLLKEGCKWDSIGDVFRVMKGDARSLENGSKVSGMQCRVCGFVCRRNSRYRV